ncbi:MAG TPA: thioredoxin [Candidatus Polarisedimenticolia bacterium]|nr:thioredoxin [Candidatus Polarisedimenticolia bacterium]
MSQDLVVLSDSNFDAEISRTDAGPILVDFWAAWCGPCRMVAPILEKLAGELKGKARIGKLDVDANPGTAAQYGIRSIPTLLLFKNGKMVDQLVGAHPRETISAMINRHASA